MTTVCAKILSYDDLELGTATCFFYLKKDGFAYLVTNWHVVTGRNHLKPNFFNSNLPNKIRFQLHLKTNRETWVTLGKTKEIEIIINNQYGEAPEWLEHPKYRNLVDVVVVKIALNKIDDCAYMALSDFTGFENNKKFTPEPMEDVFVIGYPWGLSSHGIIPLYKRGSVASEPEVNIYDELRLPGFLIDCRTTGSMSGSPVLVRHNRILEQPSSIISLSSHINFAGVYSGRYYSKEPNDNKDIEITEIGIVWNHNTIDEIINSNCFGKKISEMS